MSHVCTCMHGTRAQVPPRVQLQQAPNQLEFTLTQTTVTTSWFRGMCATADGLGGQHLFVHGYQCRLRAQDLATDASL